MAKIYGTPLMMGGSGGANKNLPPLLDNFKAVKGGGTKLKDLPNGTKVKFGTYNSQTLVWRIAQDEGVTKAVLDLDYDTGKTVIGDMVVSPNKSICGNWAITGWLNATEEGGSWWANRVHYEDSKYPETEPTYSSQNGFLHGWNEADRGLLQSIEWGCDDFSQGGSPEPYQLNCKLMICSEDEAYAAWNGERFCVGFGDTPVILRDYSIGADGYSGISGMGSSTMEGAVSKSGLSNAIGIWSVCAPNPEAVVSAATDDDGCYTIDYDAFYVTIQADKMSESRANELAGAVWVYGDHIPKNVNDGTKIQLTREEITRPDGEIYITLSDIPASDAETETIVNLKEVDGKLHPYLYLSNNYENSNGCLLLRKECYMKGAWSNTQGTNNNLFPEHELDIWCYQTFPDYLDSSIKSELISVSIKVNGSIIQRQCFPLSCTEYGTSGDFPTEGSSLSYFSTNEKRIALFENNATNYWTRTTSPKYQRTGCFIRSTGDSSTNVGSAMMGYRPAFCLPLTFKLKGIKNEDGSYDMYDEVSSISTFASSEFIVEKSVSWGQTKDFHVRQFTYNSKKQYQTMLEGAIATVTLVGVPAPVTELAEQHSGSSITLTWKNPVDDEFYNRTVVMYSTEAFPASINEGTQGYSGTGETCTLEGLDLGNTYYISVFTVSEQDTHGEGEHVSVEIPAGQLISSLASGTKVKLGKWNNTDLQWKVARDAADQSLRLVLEPTSVTLLGNMQWDAAEPSNSDSNRRSYGNNRYIYSNIHQWLNATKAAGWYTAQHSADAAPNYASSAGFLSGWSENHLNALDRPTLTVSRSSIDGGGTETFVSRVALMSTTELRLESGTGNGWLDIFNSDGDRATGSIYWTRTPNSSISWSVRPVGAAGALGMFSRADHAYGVRPLCSPKSTVLVSLEMDDDNCYVVQ